MFKSNTSVVKSLECFMYMEESVGKILSNQRIRYILCRSWWISFSCSKKTRYEYR